MREILYVVKAVIDLGYNSFRLSIYDTSPYNTFRILDTDKAFIRLGEDLTSCGKIREEKVEEAKEVLARFSEKIRRAKVEEVISAGTSAFRYASNGEEIAKKFSEILGVKINIVSGYEESRFSTIGVLNTLPIKNGVIVDLGGGSLETSKIEDREIEDVKYYPLGALKMSKKSEWEIRKEVRDSVTPMESKYIYITGGNVRALAKLDSFLNGDILRSIHGYYLSREAVRNYAKTIFNMSVEERAKLPGVNQERAYTLGSALVIIDELMEIMGAERLVVSSFGFREGLLTKSVVSYSSLKDSWIKSLYYFHRVPFPELFNDYDPLVKYTSLITIMMKAVGYLDPYLACFNFLTNTTLPGFFRDEIKKMASICYYAREGRVMEKLGVKMSKRDLENYSLIVKSYTETKDLW